MAEEAAAASSSSSSSSHEVSITITKGGKVLGTVDLPENATVEDLVIACEHHSSVEPDKLDWDKARFIARGRTLKATEDAGQSVAHLDGAKVTILVPTLQEIQNLQRYSDAARNREARRVAQSKAAKTPTARRVAGVRTLADTGHNSTFLRVEPLPGLPNPEKSRDFLLRLKEDPGIRYVMMKHKFTVGLLTEMEPLSNTQSSHEGTTRLLGLNRNKGEVIELRLRTDAYDGYRDYKTIRNTLCHELAHNVFGPHDRKFWDLCHLIEREVQSASSGHVVSNSDYYQSPEDDAPDHEGWVGGTYVLGGNDTRGLTRREVLAKAAEERLQKPQSENPDAGNGEGQ